MSWYNGFSPTARRAAIPIQRAAAAAGVLVLPAKCSICGAPATEWHDEDYRDCLNPFAVCRRCHIAVHGRFADAQRWIAFIDLYSETDQWAWQVTIDPLSKFRQFELTYPNGVSIYTCRKQREY